MSSSTPTRFLPAPRPQPTPAEIFKREQEEAALAEASKRQKDGRVLPIVASESSFVKRYLGALDQAKKAQEEEVVAQAAEIVKAEMIVDKKKVVKRMFGSFSRYGDLGIDDVESVGVTLAVSAHKDVKQVLGPIDENRDELDDAYEDALMAMVDRRRLAIYLLRWRVASKSRHRRRKIAELVALASTPVQRSPHAAVMELVATTTAKQPLHHHRRNRRAPSVFEKDKGGVEIALTTTPGSPLPLPSPRKRIPGTRPLYSSGNLSDYEPPKHDSVAVAPIPVSKLVRKVSKEIIQPGAPVPRAWALERHASKGNVIRRSKLQTSTSEESKRSDSPPPSEEASTTKGTEATTVISPPALTLLIHPVKTRVASPSIVRTCATPTEDVTDPRWLPPSLANKQPIATSSSSSASRPRLNMSRPGAPMLRRRSSLLQASTAAYIASQSPRTEDLPVGTSAFEATPTVPLLAVIKEDLMGSSTALIETPSPALETIPSTVGETKNKKIVKKKQASLVRLFFASLFSAFSTQLVTRKPVGHPDATGNTSSQGLGADQALPKPRRRPNKNPNETRVNNEQPIPASS